MSNRYLPIHLGKPGEDISKKDLHSVIQRFKHFNQARLLQMMTFLQPRQRDFLHLLPLLFHQNHPLLPGFVSLETPAGIPDYSPTKQTLEVAQQFSKGFLYKRKALRQYPIESLFLMGSVGSMAFSKDSDIDIWLCHRPGMALDDVQLLTEKTRRIEQWAATLKLEVHVFLIDSQQFKDGQNAPLSAESSGETQHYLLLEEFYRTSIYIAGKAPAWWLVPPSQENNYDGYVEHLLNNRFIAEADVIDFGGLQHVPLSEFLGATLWHVYKSLSSPHKSLLKLFLMESYASEYPAPKWLCQQMKLALYSGDFSVAELDPYLLIYSKVDAHLQQQASVRRLMIVRECLYHKIMEGWAPGQEIRLRDQRDHFLQTVAAKWKWPGDLLADLQNRRAKTIEQAYEEHTVICDQLQQCLQRVMSFAGQSISLDERISNDLTLISRKLHTFLDDKPGKVEILTTRALVETSARISVRETRLTDGGSEWALQVSGTSHTHEGAPVRYAANALELLAWIVINGVYRRRSNLHLHSADLPLGTSDTQSLMELLTNFLERRSADTEVDLSVYTQADSVLSSLLLINFDEPLPVDLSKPLMMSERSDPLSYGDGRVSFIRSVQRLSISRWGEIRLKSYRELEGLFDCLLECFNDGQSMTASLPLTVACFTPMRGKSISQRTEQIAANLQRYFANDGTAALQQRYIVAAANGYALFYWQDNHLRYYLLETNNQLLQELGSSQTNFSQIRFDSHVLANTYIPFLYGFNQADTIQLFYHATSQHVAVYVIDENGSFYARQHSQAQPEQVLQHYAVFLETLQAQGKLPMHLARQFYEIQKNSAGVASCQALTVKAVPMALRVRVIAEQDDARLAIYCNERRFSAADADFFPRLREHILKFRKSHDEYPFHVTEIDLPEHRLSGTPTKALQTIHYLQYKQKIEEKLNL